MLYATICYGMLWYATIYYGMLRYATVIVYNEQLPKSWGDKFSKMPKISGSVCFIFWPIPKSSEITSQVTWELTIFVCRFRVDLFPDKSPMCRDEHTLGAEGFWWFWYGSIGLSQPKKNRPFASKATASVLFGSQIPESRSKGHLRKLDDQQETTRDVNMSYNPKKKYP